MPDANGNIKGIGYSRRAAEGWERAFGGGGLSTKAADTLRLCWQAQRVGEHPESAYLNPLSEEWEKARAREVAPGTSASRET